MKRNTGLVPLSHDHHHALRLAVSLMKNGELSALAQRTLAFWDSDLNYHFSAEESILFPACRNHDVALDILFERMLREHTAIRAIISSLGADQYDETMLRQLGKLLESHVRFEERELFPLIEAVIPDSELNALEEKFRVRK